MKRPAILAAVAAAAALACTGAQAHADIGVYLGIPGPVVEVPPPVVYQAPPVVYEPAPVYGYPYGGEYWEHRDGYREDWHHERGHHHRHEENDD